MTTIVTIRTDTWAISIPGDWIEKGQTDEGALYFESSDGSMGIYISAWHFNEEPPRSSQDLAESFKAIDLKYLHNMDGYSWRTVAEETENLRDSTVTVTDSLADAKSYRIVGKILARSPVVVRASFHDYDCTHYGESQACFAPIIQSLQFNDVSGRADR